MNNVGKVPKKCLLLKKKPTNLYKKITYAQNMDMNDFKNIPNKTSSFFPLY